MEASGSNLCFISNLERTFVEVRVFTLPTGCNMEVSRFDSCVIWEGERLESTDKDVMWKLIMWSNFFIFYLERTLGEERDFAVPIGCKMEVSRFNSCVSVLELRTFGKVRVLTL